MDITTVNAFAPVSEFYYRNSQDEVRAVNEWERCQNCGHVYHKSSFKGVSCPFCSASRSQNNEVSTSFVFRAIDELRSAYMKTINYFDNMAFAEAA